MGEEEGGGHLVHKGVVSDELQVGHAAGYFFGLGPGVLGDEDLYGPGQGGIAQEVELLPGQVGEEAYLDGALHIYVLAEGPADEDLLYLVEFYAQGPGQDGDAAVNSGLGAGEAVDVHLGDGDVLPRIRLLGPGQDKLGPVLPPAGTGAHGGAGDPKVPIELARPGH